MNEDMYIKLMELIEDMTSDELDKLIEFIKSIINR